MRQLILVACLAIVNVSAKPGPGYTYNKPAGGGLPANLLPPSPSVGQQFAPSHGSFGLNHNSNGASLALGTSYSASSPVVHAQHSFNGHNHGGLLSSLASHVPSASYGPPNHHVAAPSFTPTIAIVAPSPSPPSSSYVGSSFGSAPSSSFNSFSSVAPSAGAEQTIVQKHIYVHVPPPDFEEQQIINQAPPAVSHQKHYKIIFIKAPSPPSIQEQLIKLAPPPQVNEEKTLVYVLVKKPDGLQELRQAQAAQAIQAAQTVQSKPEVYFIKYKAEKGASPSLGSLVGNLPLAGSSSASSGNVDLSSLGLSSGASFSGSSEFSSPSSLSENSVISSSLGHIGGNTYLPPVENPPPSAISSGEGSSLSSSSVSEIIQPRTPATEYGPPKH